MPEELKIIITKLSWVLGIVLAGILLTFILLHIMRKVIKKADRDPLLEFFLVNLIKVVMIIVIVTAVLEKLNIIRPSHFITLMGVVGAAVALAVKDTLANIAGGINIIMTLPFRHGDYVRIEDAEGVVEETKFMTTVLNTLDNKQITIPNNKVANSVIVNHSAADIRRIEPKVMISDKDDINRAKEILLSIADTSPLVLKDPKPFVGISGMRYGVVDLTFRIWCNTKDCDELMYFMNETIKIAFDEADIGILKK